MQAICMNQEVNQAKYQKVLLEDKGSKSKKTNLTLKAPITTAADDIYKYFFIVFQRK